MNFGNFGLAEMLFILPLTVLFWGLPIVATIWVVVTLTRMRRLLEQVVARLDTLAERHQ